jgi:hypothetical protein
MFVNVDKLIAYCNHSDDDGTYYEPKPYSCSASHNMVLKQMGGMKLKGFHLQHTDV